VLLLGAIAHLQLLLSGAPSVAFVVSHPSPIFAGQVGLREFSTV